MTRQKPDRLEEVQARDIRQADDELREAQHHMALKEYPAVEERLRRARACLLGENPKSPARTNAHFGLKI